MTQNSTFVINISVPAVGKGTKLFIDSLQYYKSSCDSVAPIYPPGWTTPSAGGGVGTTPTGAATKSSSSIFGTVVGCVVALIIVLLD
jgi:hypothetical protein